MLKIENLHAGIEGAEILKGLNLEIGAGEVHAIMGPNGSGKSTLAQILAGREEYDVTEGAVTFDGQDLLELEPEDRAREGIFLAFQYPVEIPGVSNTYFLKAALNAIREHRGESEIDAIDFLKLAREKMKLVHDGPNYPEPHDCVVVKADVLNPVKIDPRTGQPQTILLGDDQKKQVETELAGSPYWLEKSW